MGKSKIKKDDGGGGGSGDWLNTYADMVTLLLTFFILLYSFSSVNPVKWDQLVQTFGNQKSAISSLIDSSGGESQEEKEKQIENIMNAIMESMQNLENTEETQEEATDESGQPVKMYSFNTIYEVIKEYITSNDLDSKLYIEKDENFVMIRFKDKALFDSGSINLKTESMEIIRFIVSAILVVIDEVDMIEVEGHTDTVPIKTSIYKSNRFLSSARADQVSEVLEEYGLPPAMIRAIGMDENHPIADNDTEEGKAQNRRVEIRVTRKHFELPENTIVAPTEELTANEPSTDDIEPIIPIPAE